MKASKFTNDQITPALRQAETATAKVPPGRPEASALSISRASLGRSRRLPPRSLGLIRSWRSGSIGMAAAVIGTTEMALRIASKLCHNRERSLCFSRAQDQRPIDG